MGPRKSVVSRPKRKASQISVERRTKKKNDPAQSSEAASRAFPPLSVANRVVITGRKVQFNFLDSEHFRIGDWLKNQGWENFCSLKETTYPRLVREFFENIRIGTSQLQSTVKGVLIVIDERRLAGLLEMPRNGICIPRINDRLECFKCILENEEITGIKSLQANQLSIEIRLLHSIVSRIIFPKTGRFDWVTEKDMAVMFNLIKGHQMNLPYIIMDQIKETSRRARACLPYGMMFTLIFKEFNISLEGEQGKELVHTDYFNASSLHRMGYRKHEGNWVKKSSEQEHVRETETEAESEEEESSESDSESEHQIPHSEAEIPLPSTPRTTPPPQSAATTTPSTSMSTDLLFDKLSAMLTGYKEEIIQKQKDIELKLENQCNVMKEEIQEVTARLDEMERKQGLQPELSEINKEAQRAAKRVDDLVISQQGGFGLVYSALNKMESQIGILLARTSSVPISRPSSQFTPTRPPFSSTVRSGTGFPSQPAPTKRSTHKGSSSSDPIIEFPDED